MTADKNDELLNELLIYAKQIIECDDDKRLIKEIQEIKREVKDLESKINKSKSLYNETEEIKKDIGNKISELNNQIFSKRAVLLEKFGG